ncbi:MAG: XrtA/PEP-CTERM system-associated ATPase [Bacteroidales bacterium]
MYESFYQLRERPFALTPDPDYLYPSRVHQEALSYLRYGVESHAGFVVITGEIGSGKTTLLQALLNGLDAETTVARIVNTMLAPQELLEAIMMDFGLETAGLTKPAMLRALARFLVGEREANRLVLLVIDEAQNLDLPALEEIRMLSNLETEKSKLLQVVLVGQPNLRDKLLRPELEQLRQRITVSYHLEALDADETAAYINHRLRRAALAEPLVFPREVTGRIHARSRGLPRLVNVICDATLVFGYAEERPSIDEELVEEVLIELQDTGVLAGATTGDAESAEAAAPTVPRPEPMPSAAAAAPAAMPSRPAQVDLAAMAAATRSQTETPANARRGNEREQHLRSREQQLLERERELAEQKRVLAEECRLLRERFTRPATAPGADQTAAWPPVGRSARVAAVAAVDPVQFDTRERGGFWRRMRAFLAGPIEG